jgi:hypothetical protein
MGRKETDDAHTHRCPDGAVRRKAVRSGVRLIDSQIVRRLWVSPATMPWYFLATDLAAIDTGEVDDRRTISRDHAPATTIITLNSIAYKSRPATTDRGTR